MNLSKNQKAENQKNIKKDEEMERRVASLIARHYVPPPKSFGQRAADALTSFCGSWTFIIILFLYIGVWISFNLYAWFLQWDPWPFILLNLTLSCLAAVQAPIILMSQNRQEERDRIKADRDYMINRKAEKEVENMQQDLDDIKKMLRKVIKEIK